MLSGRCHPNRRSPRVCQPALIGVHRRVAHHGLTWPSLPWCALQLWVLSKLRAVSVNGEVVIYAILGEPYRPGSISTASAVGNVVDGELRAVSVNSQ